MIAIKYGIVLKEFDGFQGRLADVRGRVVGEILAQTMAGSEHDSQRK